MRVTKNGAIFVTADSRLRDDLSKSKIIYLLPSCSPLKYYPSVVAALATWVSSYLGLGELASNALMCGGLLPKLSSKVAGIS